MPNDRSIDLDRLLAFAAHRSRGAREALMSAAVDLFLPPEQRLTDQQRALMTDILGKLITSIEVELRQYLVEALLRSSIELSELETALANDRAEVARPLLERNRAMRDEVLIELLIQRAEEHRMAVTLRHGLNEMAADTPIDHSSAENLDALLRHPDAILSRRAMEYFVAESKRHDRSQEPLLSRNDLPADLAYRLYWWVAAALRHHILQRFSVDEIALDGVIEQATRRGMAEHEEGQTAQRRAMRLAHRLNELGELTDGFILRALRQARLNLFVAGFAVRGRILFSTAWRIVTDRGLESMIILARAIEISHDTTTSILLMLDGLQNGGAPSHSPLMLADALKLFDELTVESARRVVQHWQLDSEYRWAIDMLEADLAVPTSLWTGTYMGRSRSYNEN